MQSSDAYLVRKRIVWAEHFTSALFPVQHNVIVDYGGDGGDGGDSDGDDGHGDHGGNDVMVIACSKSSDRIQSRVCAPRPISE